MEKRLQSIPLATERELATLNQLVGEYSQDSTIDDALKRKFGSAVYYIAMSNFYGIDDCSQLGESISLDTPHLGFFAYYDGMKNVCIEQRASSKGHLAIVTATEYRQLACFKAVDMSESKDKRLRNYNTSVGSTLNGVGVDLDERISVKALREILSQTPASDNYDHYVKLRSV